MMQGTGQFPAKTMLHERYLILNVVGRGGMGFVYRAQDTLNNNRVVAVKEMRQRHLSPDALPIAQQRFQQEAEILKKLTPHPHLPTFYEAFSEQGRSYLVMDFIEGKTLQQVLSEAPDNRLPLKSVLNYADQLCDVLSYLHQQSPPVVFRDLKPANVMIGARGVVYLIDFGIARHFKPGQLGDTDCFISIGYSAPENYGHDQTDPRSDLYSLGATLHHCLTGQDPSRNLPLFLNASSSVPQETDGRQSQTKKRLTYFDFPEASAYRLQIPSSLEELVLKLVATSPKHRPESAEEVKKALNLIEQSGRTATIRVAPQHVVERPAVKPSYYNPRLAHEVQFRIDWSRFNKLSGLPARLFSEILHFSAIVGAWFLYAFLPFCRKLGQQVIDGIQSLSTSWEQQRERRRNNRSKRRFSAAAFIEMPQRLSASSHGLPHLLPLCAILCFATIGSAYAIARQHTSPWLVLFVLGLCLFGLAFVVATRSTHERVVQAILSITILASLLLCAILLSQPDIAAFARGVTTGQVIALGLVLLGVAGLLHPFEQGKWLDHVIVSVGTGLGVFLQYALGTRELAWLPSSDALSVNVIMMVILGVSALIPLFLVTQEYGPLDRTIVVIAAICLIVQLIIFGNTALQPFAMSTPWSAMALNVGLIVALGSFAYLSFQFDQSWWIITARLSLLIFMVSSALILLFVSSHLTTFALSPTFDFLAASYFDPTHLSQFLIYSMIAIAGMIIFVLVRRGSFILVDLLLIIALAMPPMLLLQTLSSVGVPLYLLQVGQYAVSVIDGCIILALVLLVIAVIARFLSDGKRTYRFVTGIDRAMVLLGYTLVTISAVLCLLFLWEFGYEKGIPIGFLGQLSANTFWLLLPGAAAVFIFIKTIAALNRLLYSMSHSNRDEEEEHSRWGMDEHETVKGATFTTWDRWVMLIVAGYLAIFIAAMRGKLPVINVNLDNLDPNNSNALWLVVLGLMIAALGALSWLLRQLTKAQRIALGSISLMVSVCALVAAAGLIFDFLHPLFVFAGLAAVILLILGLALATWEEEDALMSQRNASSEPFQ